MTDRNDTFSALVEHLGATDLSDATLAPVDGLLDLDTPPPYHHPTPAKPTIDPARAPREAAAPLAPVIDLSARRRALADSEPSDDPYGDRSDWVSIIGLTSHMSRPRPSPADRAAANRRLCEQDLLFELLKRRRAGELDDEDVLRIARALDLAAVRSL